jgi:nucleotidyltransferase substrate binding protein (TIGR01987 family)
MVHDRTVERNLVMLDLSSFEKAASQLQEALSYCKSDIAMKDPHLALHLRAAAIQAFELTYEIAFKMLKRYLQATEANADAIESMTFNEIIRLGYERGLLSAELREWKAFRINRNATSHTYNETKAQDVYIGIPAFLTEARFLLKELMSHMERER